MNKHQMDMLDHLRHTDQEHPMTLEVAFNLRHESTRNSYYFDYLDLVRVGYVRTEKKGSWITKAGLEAFTAKLRENIKMPPIK